MWWCNDIADRHDWKPRPESLQKPRGALICVKNLNLTLLKTGRNEIGHFRVLLCLCFKTSLSAKPFLWKWILHAVSFSCKSKSFHTNGFALRLALKQRHNCRKGIPRNSAKGFFRTTYEIRFRGKLVYAQKNWKFPKPCFGLLALLPYRNFAVFETELNIFFNVKPEKLRISPIISIFTF